MTELKCHGTIISEIEKEYAEQAEEYKQAKKEIAADQARKKREASSFSIDKITIDDTPA